MNRPATTGAVPAQDDAGLVDRLRAVDTGAFATSPK